MVVKHLTMTELEAAIEDWEEVYKGCKLRPDTGPLPVLKEERENRLENLKSFEGILH